MAKSSINFEKAMRSSFEHNDRSQKNEPKYLLPKEFRLGNDFDFSAKQAEQKLEELHVAAKDNFKEKFGQKLQAKSFIWEAIINLNKDHTLADVKKLVKEIEKNTGFKSLQISIHRDEGHVKKDKNGKLFAIHNFHAHLSFFTLDQNTGQQLYRKQVTEKQQKEQPALKPMNRDRMSELQTLTANVLDMERGEKGSKKVREGHKQFKQSRQREQRFLNVVNAKIKDVDTANKALREELAIANASRDDYRELEILIKKLKDKIRIKDLTISDLIKRVTRAREEIKQKSIKEALAVVAEASGVTEKDVYDAVDSKIPKKSASTVSHKKLDVVEKIVDYERINVVIVEGEKDVTVTKAKPITQSQELAVRSEAGLFKHAFDYITDKANTLLQELMKSKIKTKEKSEWEKSNPERAQIKAHSNTRGLAR